MTSTTFVLFLALYSIYISRLFARPDDICQYTKVTESEITEANFGMDGPDE